MSQKHMLKKVIQLLLSPARKKANKAVIAVDIKKERRVTVKGLNLVKRHTKPSQANPQGGIIEKKVQSMYVNVMVLDPEQKFQLVLKKLRKMVLSFA